MLGDPAAPDASTGYVNIRQLLGDRYAAVPDRAIRAQMEAAYGPEAAEQYEDYLEGIFGDIGKAFSSAANDVARFAVKAAPVVAKVGGGALQGALSGAQFGLPGIIGGAALGGTGAGLSAYGGGSAKGIGGALTGLTGLAGQFSPLGRVGASLGPVVSGLAGSGASGAAGAAVNAISGLLGGAAGGAPGAPVAALANLFGGSSAAGQLVSLLQRPEMRFALEKLKLGGGGTVPVGAAGIPVPVAALGTLLRELADEAVDEAAGQYDDAESDLGYMTNISGQFSGDPVVALDRAAQVWNLLNDAQAERLLAALAALAPPTPPADPTRRRAARDQAYYDTIDLAEIYTMAGGDGISADAYDEWDGEHQA